MRAILVSALLATAMLVAPTLTGMSDARAQLSKTPGSGGQQDSRPSGGLVDASNPNALVAILDRRGFRPRLEAHNNGDPLIRLDFDGTRAVIFFYGCNNNNTDCDFIQFRATFENDGSMTEEDMGKWNRDRAIGAAYLNSNGNPAIEMPIVLEGGVSSANFGANIEWWELVLDQFKEHIGF